MRELRAQALYPGRAVAPILKLGAPVCFWGAINPETGIVVDPRHPDCGKSVAGRILVVPGAVGSSSSSAVMLELLRGGVAPAAVILTGEDAILALGVIIARELGYPTIPVLRVSTSDFDALPASGNAVVDGQAMKFG